MEKIITSDIKHLDGIAYCHRVAFPESLATALGKRFVKAMLSWYLTSDKVFLFHLEDETGNILGYCGGIISDGTLKTGSSSGMAQHTFRDAILGFITHPWVIFHKEVRKKWPVLWKNILMKLGLQSKNHFTSVELRKMAIQPEAGLVVIGVHPRFQGKGFGSILLKEFEARVSIKYGIHKMNLNVLADNFSAIKAYEKNGWSKVHEDHGHLTMTKLI